MDNKKIYLVNVTAQGISRVISFAANFGVFILIARLSGVELFGQYSYVLAFLGLFTAIVDFGTGATLAKDIAQVKENVGNYWGNFLILRLYTAVIIILISIIIAYYMRHDLFVSIMIGLFALPFLASRFFEPIFQVYQKPWFSFYPALCYSASYFFITLAILLLGAALVPLITAFIAANIIYTVVAFGLVCLVLKPEFKPNWPVMKSILKISLPIGISSLFAIANSKVAVFMLAAMKSDYEVAIYNAADRLLNPAVLMIVTLIAPIIPIFSNKAKSDAESLKRNYRKIVELLGMVALPIAIMVPLVSPQVMNMIFGPSFIQSAAVLNIMAWTAILIFLSVFNSIVLLAKGIVNFAYWNTAIALVFSIILNFIWIPQYGTVGSAWAALLCEMFLSGVTVFYILRYMGKVYVWQKLIRIFGVNLLMYMFLYEKFLAVPPFAKMIYALVLYLFLLYIFCVKSDFGRKFLYLSRFIYRKQVLIDFPMNILRRYINHVWDLPPGYAIRSPRRDDKELKEWADLLNSDGGFGIWTPERVKSDIINNLISPDAASLLFYKDKLIGCGSTSADLFSRKKKGIGMWLFLDQKHRGKKCLPYSLAFRTMAYFARENYYNAIAFTDPSRLSAIYLYLSNGCRARYDCLYSFIHWHGIMKRLRPLLERERNRHD